MKNKIPFNDLIQIIKESIQAEENSRIKFKYSFCEGIDVDTGKRRVFYNPNHQNLVDTSVETNPTISNDLIPGVEVWSIFKRKRSFDPSFSSTFQLDGNPLIHAFKQENGWDFNSDDDKLNILEQVEKIINKFNEIHGSYPVTIMMPTTSMLNSIISRIYKKINPDVKIFDDILRKLTVKEIKDELFSYDNEAGIEFINKFKGQDDKLRLLEKYFIEMEDKHNGIFTYHLIKDRELRNSITHTLALTDTSGMNAGNEINEHDILLLDDSISRGSSLKQAVKLIKDVYNPNSITVMTLFSAL